MSMEEQLGKLIVSLNPYSKVMHFGSAGPSTNMAGTRDAEASISDNLHFELEVADQYAETWEFKGEPQNVNKAVRIKYRWPVFDSENKGSILYWITDYLLIGFEGSGGS
jgi:hypothetical protein